MGAGLAAHRGVPPERGLVGECPPTRIAHEWLLPRVDRSVDQLLNQKRFLNDTIWGQSR